ncbi:hypothetical protein GJAV_G00072200 [Gymnothorax javanicus]|nr:hypothetical protein GJAV_G00072200 [Gymnothorax javanicus]
MLPSLKRLMLTARQICSIFVLVFLNLLPAEAEITAYTFDNRTEVFEDLPARFGYRLPRAGLKGFLIGANPENGCGPIVPPPLAQDSLTGTIYIALIRRMDCDFDVKVLNAQKAGYKAVIVHNVNYDDLIPMESDDLDIMKQIVIPSVFVGEQTGKALKDEYSYEEGGHVILTPDFTLPLEYYLIPFIIIVAICIILIVVFMITKFVQDRHKARRSRLRKDQLKKLPIHKFKKAADVYDVCAICLDEYEEGDKLRVLPCSHAYHCKCVDPWLTKTKKTCPVCKQKVVPSQGDSSSDSDSDEAESSQEGATESTPLLRPLTFTSTRSFGSVSGQERDPELSDYDDEETDSSESDEEGERGADSVVVETVVAQLQQSWSECQRQADA